MSQPTQTDLPTHARESDSALPEIASAPARRKYSKALLLLFLLTLPFVNPWVRGDGVGYYAYVRSLLVSHNLDFAPDWRAANTSFAMGRVREDGSIDPSQYTQTGHLANHFAVGPSMLWAPILVPVHGMILILQRFGVHVRADGYSRPYLVTMALATALYGFLSILLSFHLACRYVEVRWAWLATVGIWFASPFPVYMYFNPSWSHAHSAFAVAVFLWYWHRTRQRRTLGQWVILGLISGLVLDIYYANLVVLLVPLVESLLGYWRAWRTPGSGLGGGRLFGANLLYCLATLAAFLPTLITRQIIYGNPRELGYRNINVAQLATPHLGSVLFSSDHGLLVWTPILIPAMMGLLLFYKRDHEFAASLLIVWSALYCLISIDDCWDGISSFGNRFFVSLTPLFVLGLAVTFSEFARWVGEERRAVSIASSVTALLVLWNLGFIFQWGTHMVPARGPISWKQMVRNQFVGVPRRVTSQVLHYFENRTTLMQNIEEEDMRQMQQQQGPTDTK